MRNIYAVFHGSWINLHSHQQCTKFPFHHIIARIYCLFDNPNKCAGVFITILICISLLWLVMLSIYSCILATCVSLLEQYLLRFCVHFKIRLFSLCYWNVWVPHIFLILFNRWFEIFFPFHRLPFHLIDFFSVQTFLVCSPTFLFLYTWPHFQELFTKTNVMNLPPTF